MSASVRFKLALCIVAAIHVKLSSSTATSCPSVGNWTKGPDGNCYAVFTQPTPFLNGAADAELLCTRNGSQLASIASSGIEDFIGSLLDNITSSAGGVRYAYIGYTDIDAPGNFSWTDNTAVAYSNLMSAEANKYFISNDSRCVALLSSSGQWQTGRTWVVVPCCFQYNQINAVVCAYDETPAVPAPRQSDIHQYCYGSCPTNYYRSGSNCYTVSTSTTVYQSAYYARQACLAIGGDFPSIDSSLTESFLIYVLANKAAELGRTSPAVYIGMNAISSRRAVWSQLTSTRSNYTNWAPGQPSIVFTPRPDNKTTTCAQMIWNQTISSWVAASCCTPANVSWVACQKPINTSVSVPMGMDVFAAKCYTAFNECSSNPCFGNATCNNGLNGHTCVCGPAYSGSNCSIPACRSNPCQNGGTCVMNSVGYTCSCSSSYSGILCENVINQCVYNPCKNGGTCAPSGFYNYTCTCPFGTSGVSCQINVDECVNKTCANGGTCKDYIGFANCSCPPQYGGDTCTETIKCVEPSTPGNSTQNGTVLGNGPTSASFPWAFQSTISFMCIPGFKFPDMNRRKTISCVKNSFTNTGNWNESLANCEPHCDELPTVGHAIIANANTAVGTTVNFTCETGFIFSDNTTTVNTTCAVGRTWTNSLINSTCNIRTCPVLPKYPYQTLDTLNNTYNTTVTFWCDVGYVLFDNTTARTIKCLADGNWTADLPPCNPVKCPQLAVPSGASRNTSNNTYMTYAQYSCNQNTRMLDGSTYRIILCDATAEWSDNVTDCTSTRCFPLPFVANATPSTTDADYWTVSTLTCIKGHRFMLGNNVELNAQSMTCQPNGWWSPILTFCQPILCGPVPKGGNMTASTTNQLYGTVVNYNCLTGYYVNPNHPTNQYSSLSIECLENKQWNFSTIPSCYPIRCSQPPTIVNGTRILPNPVLYNYSASVNYKCNPGFRFIDGRTDKNIVCTAVGFWDDTDVSCRSDRCPPLEIQPNSIPSTFNTSWYTNVTYSCRTGYEWKENSTKRTVACQAGGNWNDTFTPQDDCIIKRCSPVEVMSNATTNSSDNFYNTYLNYRCNTGFKYADNSTSKTRWCSDMAQWKPNPFPKCNIIHCPALADVENATKNTNDTYYDIDVTFTCLPGYQFPDKAKQKHMYCTENATWTDYPDPCEVIFCPPLPTWSEAVFNSTDNNFLSVVTYWCQDGYAFKGYTIAPGNGTVMTSKCLANKNWFPSILDCQSLTAINSAIAGKTYNSPQSVPIGTVACTMMCLVVVGVVLLDISKLVSDFKLLRENVGKLLRGGRSNKIKPSPS